MSFSFLCVCSAAFCAQRFPRKKEMTLDFLFSDPLFTRIPFTAFRSFFPRAFVYLPCPSGGHFCMHKSTGDVYMGGGKTNIWRDLISPLFSHHPISCLRLPVLIVKQWGGKKGVKTNLPIALSVSLILRAQYPPQRIRLVCYV